jgi:hypothetical protein
MTGWILILFAHVGVMGQGNSNALTTAQFSTEKACVAAGDAARQLAKSTVKEISFVCKPQ